MRKLPGDRMMDVMLAKDQVTLEMTDRVANKIADFHNRAETSPEISKFGTIEAITFNTEEKFSARHKSYIRADNHRRTIPAYQQIHP